MSKAVEGYLLNAEGNSFDATTTATPAVPFRPYFVASSAGSRRAVQHILFDSDDSSFAIGDDKDPSEGEATEGMIIRAGNHKVVVISNLKRSAEVRIFNISGLCVAHFNIEPGQTVETPVHIAGVYIVHAAGGRYQKKLAVR